MLQGLTDRTFIHWLTVSESTDTSMRPGTNFLSPIGKTIYT